MVGEFWVVTWLTLSSIVPLVNEYQVVTVDEQKTIRFDDQKKAINYIENMDKEFSRDITMVRVYGKAA